MVFNKNKNGLRGSRVSSDQVGFLPHPSYRQSEENKTKSKIKKSKEMEKQVRKQNYVENMVVGVKMLLTIVFLGILSSCEKNDVTSVSPTADQSASYKASTENKKAKLHSRGIQAFPADPEEALQGESFFFKFTASESVYSRLNMEVKFTAPSGEVVYAPMDNWGIQYDGSVLFTLNRVLSQYGKYEFEYGFRYGDSFTKMPNTTSYSLWVLHPNIALGEDGYPYTSSDSNTPDKWGFIKRWCTSWVAHAVNRMWGTDTDFHNKMDGGHLGWASNWKNELTKLGYEADNTPRVGDIAWWSEHVAFVNEVRSDGTITITEYNGTNSLAYSSRTVSTSQNYPESFIHVQTKRQ
jgi:CHAP domain